MATATDPMEIEVEASRPLQDLSNFDPVQNQPNKRLRLSQPSDNDPRACLDSLVRLSVLLLFISVEIGWPAGS
jgi:hypothetical protein